MQDLAHAEKTTHIVWLEGNGVRASRAHPLTKGALAKAWAQRAFSIHQDWEWRFKCRSLAHLAMAVKLMGDRGMMIRSNDRVNVSLEFWERENKKHGGPVIGKSLPGYGLGKLITAKRHGIWTMHCFTVAKHYEAHRIVRDRSSPYSMLRVAKAIDRHFGPSGTGSKRYGGGPDATVDATPFAGGVVLALLS